jgi:hypothetical protein
MLRSLVFRFVLAPSLILLPMSGLLLSDSEGPCMFPVPTENSPCSTCHNAPGHYTGENYYTHDQVDVDYASYNCDPGGQAGFSPNWQCGGDTGNLDTWCSTLAWPCDGYKRIYAWADCGGPWAITTTEQCPNQYFEWTWTWWIDGEGPVDCGNSAPPANP